MLASWKHWFRSCRLDQVNLVMSQLSPSLTCPYMRRSAGVCVWQEQFLCLCEGCLLLAFVELRVQRSAWRSWSLCGKPLIRWPVNLYDPAIKGCIAVIMRSVGK